MREADVYREIESLQPSNTQMYESQFQQYLVQAWSQSPRETYFSRFSWNQSARNPERRGVSQPLPVMTMCNMKCQAYLGQWSQTVGSAGCIGDDVILVRVVLLLIHAHDKHGSCRHQAVSACHIPPKALDSCANTNARCPTAVALLQANYCCGFASTG